MISEKESDFSEQVEATLIKQAQAGSQESLNVLLLWHERLVHLTTLPFCCYCFDVPAAHACYCIGTKKAPSILESVFGRAPTGACSASVSFFQPTVST
ncbi:MAG: hypothetical protein ABSA23_15835 [Anaerolineales bacterium]|jgi:hypothetical protein